jgi:hypothetical protein
VDRRQVDGKAVRAIARGHIWVEVLSDREVFAIIRGGSR